MEKQFLEREAQRILGLGARRGKVAMGMDLLIEYCSDDLLFSPSPSNLMNQEKPEYEGIHDRRGRKDIGRVQWGL